MPDYILPCTCGQRLKVSTAQAGQTVRCACGSELSVPTLRGLRELEIDSAPTKPRGRQPRSWDNRHRLVFALVVAALGCLITAGYFLLQVPVQFEPVSYEQATAWLDTGTPTEVLEVFRDLQKGLPPSHADAEMIEEIRAFFLWAMSLSLLLALAALIAAAVVAFTRPRKRSPQQEVSR